MQETCKAAKQPHRVAVDIVLKVVLLLQLALGDQVPKVLQLQYRALVALQYHATMCAVPMSPYSMQRLRI